MALSMNVTFSGELAEKIQRLATLRHQDINSLFETLVEQALPEQSESDEIATSEMKTYIALHPMLKQKYFGQYVAIYQGKFVAMTASVKPFIVGLMHNIPTGLYGSAGLKKMQFPHVLFMSDTYTTAMP